MIEQIMAFLKENQLASGGLLIATFTAALAYMRDVPLKLWQFIKRRTVLEVEILERDPAYSWMIRYIHKNEFCRRSRKLSVVTGFKRGGRGGMPLVHGDDEDEPEPEIFLIPAPGLHFFFYKKVPILLNMVRQEQAPVGQAQNPRQELNLTTLYRWKSTVEDMLEQARLLEVTKKEVTQLKILLPGSYDSWLERGECEPRALDSVILKKGVKEAIIKDVEKFRGSKEWYSKVGIPYKRGYLLYGPPGNGKTTLVKAIASEFDLKLCVLPLEGMLLADSSLPGLFHEIPKNSILLIEDIDCAVGKRADKDNKVAMSVLLNCLDGISSPEGKMFFMTTNRLDKLDKALVRSGRCDFKVFLGDADKHQVKQMFSRFFPDHGDISGIEVPDDGLNVSSVQEHLLRHRDSWENALKTFGSLFK